MALETASFISELSVTNPVGATDPKSEGDDHLRLIKTAIKGSFPSFVGTAGVPKSISLTEDQLNDAAQKAAIATISALWNFTTEPTLNGDITGRQRLRRNNQNGNYTLLLSDAGRYVFKTGGAGNTITVPADSVVQFEDGDVVAIVNRSGNTVAIAITDDTMTLESDGSTGTRTLADQSIATLMKVTATNWMIMGGAGLT